MMGEKIIKDRLVGQRDCKIAKHSLTNQGGKWCITCEILKPLKGIEDSHTQKRLMPVI